MAEAIVHGPGEGDIVSVAGNEIVFKAVAAETGGAFGLMEYTAPLGFTGPPPHVAALLDGDPLDPAAVAQVASNYDIENV